MSDKDVVRLEDTDVVDENGVVDMASLSKSGCEINE